MLDIKIPFRKQQFEAREEAILDAVNRLLSEKGFDLMTMDDVADEVGVAKGSLYKHFSSKERLAAATLTRLLNQTLEVLEAMPADWTPGKRLEEILRWSVQHRLRGGVPHLPSTRGALQRALMLSLDYLAVAMKVNKHFYGLVRDAKAAGELSSALPDDVIVYTLYSRSCDPTVEFLVKGGKIKNEDIVEAMVTATFEGLRSRAP